MTKAAREKLFDAITATADVGVAIVDVDEIDILNIPGDDGCRGWRALADISTAVDYALIDGNRMPVIGCEGEAVVKGDGRSLSIAARSVIAKVTRDRLMRALAETYHGYGWERNAGYGTAEHMDASNGSVQRLSIEKVLRQCATSCLRSDSDSHILPFESSRKPLNPFNC